ncbi:hypothetical protein EAE99_000369 [Botrytis elliptica]|nr:hypothetical protein EAE99_000369 [Botrytis elliptica]
MDPQGNHHQDNECEFDHECDQEIQEVIQQVLQQVIHPESNGFELDNESGQEVVQRTNQEQDNTSESVHSLDGIESQENSGDEGSHGSIVMKIQMISTTRRYRGRIVTATVAAIDDAAIIIDLPIEELFLTRISTLLPKSAGIPDTWSMTLKK